MSRRVVEPLGSRRKIRLKDLFGDEREVTPTADSLVRMRAKRQEGKKRVVIRHKREL